MKREPGAKKTKRSFSGVLYWAVGCLLLFTLVTTWMVCGMFAKYVTSDSKGNAAHVAATGVVRFEVLEHKLNPDPVKVYELLDGKDGRKEETTKKNDYETVLPGFDLPKDPFVRLELKDSEVDYYLYIRVVEKDFPKDKSLVQYFIDDKMWEEVKGQESVYKFIGTLKDKDDKDKVLVSNGYFDAGTLAKTDIRIFAEGKEKIYVSEQYDGGSFNLSFEAWLVQVD